jgi:hypothetical protein
MSKDITYPFADELHLEGQFDGIKLPRATFMSNALSTGLSNMVPQKVDREGRLHYAVFNALNPAPITDIVFKVDADREDRQLADDQIKHFMFDLESRLRETDQHLAVREVCNGTITYYILRIFFTRDFKCIHHPEMRLGEPTRPYICPVCATMQISGLPHIEDTSE